MLRHWCLLLVCLATQVAISQCVKPVRLREFGVATTPTYQAEDVKTKYTLRIKNTGQNGIREARFLLEEKSGSQQTTQTITFQEPIKPAQEERIYFDSTYSKLPKGLIAKISLTSVLFNDGSSWDISGHPECQNAKPK